MSARSILILGSLGSIAISSSATVDLLDRYPTRLTGGDTAAERARAWQFADPDIFRLSRFELSVAEQLRVAIDEADLGIGHSTDGAVWAVVFPKQEGTLKSQIAEEPESVSHVWLRFHPGEINKLFPPETVFTNKAGGLEFRIRAIANAKMRSSWQAGGKALIPEPKDLTLDIDTKGAARRFFVVDTRAGKADYVRAFERRALKQPPMITADLAQQAFNKLWEAFDREYAMFVLRPEVDWARQRERYRAKALSSSSTEDFVQVCAEMLKPLRDLHIWLTVAGNQVSVFNRERLANSNPAAHPAILGDLRSSGRIQWAITPDKIGFIAIHGWNGTNLVKEFDEILEQMRETHGLILDVRLNGGGSEDLAREVAGRFLEKEFVYGYSQYRNGPNHTNLTQRYERKAKPRDVWRYERKVILLIGQKCMSSSESFVAMMSGAPQVTIMGDRTCGSSGNPKIIQLPLEMTVSVPRWIDYLPDGTPLDERGFQPKEKFKPRPDAFQGERDDLLSAALGRLRNLSNTDK